MTITPDNAAFIAEGRQILAQEVYGSYELEQLQMFTDLLLGKYEELVSAGVALQEPSAHICDWDCGVDKYGKDYHSASSPDREKLIERHTEGEPQRCDCDCDCDCCEEQTYCDWCGNEWPCLAYRLSDLDAAPPAPSHDGEKLELHYCPAHGDLIIDADGNEVTSRSDRCREGHSVSEVADALVTLVAVDEAKLDAAMHEVASIHQIHGDTCLCGFTSARSRSRTEHITEAFSKLLGGGER